MSGTDGIRDRAADWVVALHEAGEAERGQAERGAPS